MSKNEINLLRKEQHWIKRYIELNRFIKACTSKSSKHLDFGCGYGSFAYLLACEHPKMQVVGIDTDKAKILAGKKRYKISNLKLVCPSRIRGKFDSISCLFVLHEISNLHLKHFYNHLTQKGKIFVLDFRRVSKEKFRKLFYEPKAKLFKLKSFEEEYRCHTKWNVRQFEKMFEEAGFKTLAVKPVGELHCLYLGKK
jgi:ubiquinone/menaquinone biosynthesis C-methylase UbiE